MPRREGAYRVYLGAAVVLVAVAPVARMLLLVLLEPASIAWLVSPDFAVRLRLIAAAVLPLALLLGTVRGPVRLTPFQVVTMASNHLPRRVSLWRPFLKSLLLAGGATAVLAALPAVALVAAGGASALAATSCVAACVALSCTGVVARLAGQVVGTGRAWQLAALALLVGLSPFGIGASIAAAWQGLAGGAIADGALLAMLSMVVVASVSVALAPRLLDRVRGDVLLLHARRRESAAMSFASGEISGALSAYREAPSTGRSLRAVVGGPRVLAMLLRDAVGALRTPQRTALGVLGLSLAALCVSTAAGAAVALGSAPAVGVVAAVGAVALFASLGSFADGFRHAADAAAGADIFGTPVAEQFLLHAAFPVAIVLVVVGAASLLSGGGLAPVLVGLAAVAARAYESARGHLPPLLLTPMPSELGDLSVVARLAWQFDSLIIASGLGVAITLLCAFGLPSLALLLLAAAALVLAFATKRRLHYSRGERTS
ncbi:hypothetical protein [Pseudoclavibacter helvolus]|uniref:hypothetical protein n=1 Tax=Pseudoclavibacter helvolus TaxID=255205 RepID=UPI003C739ADE